MQLENLMLNYPKLKFDPSQKTVYFNISLSRTSRHLLFEILFMNQQEKFNSHIYILS
jgi:hypothetical protein